MLETGDLLRIVMRINKFLSTAGVASRRKCDELIKNGKIFVNGKVVTSFVDIDEKKDVVEYNGERLTLPSSFIYLKMNKPKGYACTASDEKGRKTIFDLLDDKSVRLFNVGRLDYDTEGLIFLTNDGDFANRIIHPKFEIDKEYIVTVDGKMQESEFAVLRNGVVVNGERMPEARVKPISFDSKFTKLSVIINEGQNHQVRRMFEAIGRSIKLLKRIRIGNVKLGNLYRGKIKKMTEEEIESFK